jgi:O-antigen/teichoic acid export membrane protein
MLTGIFLARSCTQEAFGYYVVAFSAIVITVSLNQALIVVPLNVFLPRQPTKLDRNRFVASTGILQLLYILSYCLLCGGASLAMAVAGQTALSVTLLAAAPAIFGVLMKEYVRRGLLAQMQVKRALVPDVAAMLLQLGGLGALAFLGRLDIPMALLTIGICQFTVAAFSWMFLFPKSGALDFGAARRQFLSHWRMSGGMAATVALSLLATQAYPWFLHLGKGAVAAACFGAALNLTAVSNPIALAFSSVIAPQAAHAFAKDGFAGVARVTHAGTWIVLSTIGVIGALVSLFAKPLLHLVYGEQYASLSYVVPILALYLLANAAAMPLGHALTVLGRIRHVMAASLAMALLTITIGLGLTLKWGATGAACGVALATLVYLGLRIVFYARAKKTYCIAN